METIDTGELYTSLRRSMSKLNGVDTEGDTLLSEVHSNIKRSLSLLESKMKDESGLEYMLHMQNEELI